MVNSFTMGNNCSEERKPDHNSYSLIQLQSYYKKNQIKDEMILNMYPLKTNIRIRKNGNEIKASLIPLKRTDYFSTVPSFFFLTPSYQEYEYSDYSPVYSEEVYPLKVYLELKYVHPNYEIFLTNEQVNLINQTAKNKD